MATKYYKATLYNDGTFEVSDYKGDADTLITTQSICGFVRFDDKKAAINAIRKHLEKKLIKAKEEVDKIEKVLLQLKKKKYERV